MSKKRSKRIRAVRDNPQFVTITVSTATLRHLKRLSTTGMYGMDVSGVVEGFVYQGLQKAMWVES